MRVAILVYLLLFVSCRKSDINGFFYPQQDGAEVVIVCRDMKNYNFLNEDNLVSVKINSENILYDDFDILEVKDNVILNRIVVRSGILKLSGNIQRGYHTTTQPEIVLEVEEKNNTEPKHHENRVPTENKNANE